jgi:hypothetical protein
VTDTVLVLLTLVVAGVRCLMAPRLDLPTAQGSYEAFAHLFVGGLFGAWVVRRTKLLWLVLAASVSILELVLFIVQKLAQ